MNSCFETIIIISLMFMFFVNPFELAFDDEVKECLNYLYYYS